MPKKTCEVVKAEGIAYHRIVAALRAGKLTPPAKDGSGDYVWAPEDVERLRRAVALDRRRQRRVKVAS